MPLDNGTYFDVNAVVRAGLKTGTCKLILPNGQEVTADLRMNVRDRRGRFQLPDQTIELVAMPRHFGGCQWYWICPLTGDRCRVLYWPHGHKMFAGQRYWRQRRMAYSSQFLAPHNRARLGIRRIEARLGSKEAEDTLYKPKWQRWRTFNRYCNRLDAYDSVIAAYERALDERLLRCVGRLLARR
jgi:hypothetical protein